MRDAVLLVVLIGVVFGVSMLVLLRQRGQAALLEVKQQALAGTARARQRLDDDLYAGTLTPLEYEWCVKQLTEVDRLARDRDTNPYA